MASANGDPQFQVAYTEDSRLRLKQSATACKIQGLAASYRDALVRINHQLHHRPLEFGEALFRVYNPAGEARVGGIGIVAVDYVVYFEERKVVVYWVHIML